MNSPTRGVQTPLRNPTVFHDGVEAWLFRSGLNVRVQKVPLFPYVRVVSGDPREVDEACYGLTQGWIQPHLEFIDLDEYTKRVQKKYARDLRERLVQSAIGPFWAVVFWCFPKLAELP